MIRKKKEKWSRKIWIHSPVVNVYLLLMVVKNNYLLKCLDSFCFNSFCFSFSHLSNQIIFCVQCVNGTTCNLKWTFLVDLFWLVNWISFFVCEIVSLQLISVWLNPKDFFLLGFFLGFIWITYLLKCIFYLHRYL